MRQIMSSENIQVALRFRPPASPSPSIWSLSKSSVVLRPEAFQSLTEEKRIQGGSHPSFQYDFAFSAEDDNGKVYRSMVRRVVMSTLEGFNATVFAYGQTGSGKTYTMLGVREEENDSEEPAKAVNTSVRKETPGRRTGRSFTPLSARNRSLTPVRSDPPPISTIPATVKAYLPLTQKGIIVYSLEDIFREVGESMTKHYFFACSYMEIYNERVFDLLKETNEMKNEILNIVENSEKDFYVRGLSEHSVSSISDVLSQLERGEINRHYAATSMNHNSSRSHTIFRLNIRSIQVIASEDEEVMSDKGDNIENITTESILNFVDLAGSERVGNIQPLPDKPSQFLPSKPESDKLLTESKNINTSLFYLCQVITKLAEMKLGVVRSDAHVPFRNSNLTKILRSSLGGNARTCILCTATPTISHFEQTISTLRFGTSARSITNKIKANVKRETSAQILMAYEQDVSVLRKELEALALRNKATQSENSVTRQVLETRIRKLTQLLYEKTRPNGTEQEPTYAGWVDTAGDLISSLKVIDSKGESKPRKTVRCDEDGQFASEKLEKVRSLYESNQSCISAVTSAVFSVKSLKSSLLQQLVATSQACEAQKTKENDYKTRLLQTNGDLTEVKARSAQYELTTSLESLKNEDLDALEATYLICLDRVKQVKSKLRVESLVKTLKNRLLGYISAGELHRITAEEGKGGMIVKDLSTIQGSVAGDSFESFKSGTKWESSEDGGFESPGKLVKP